MATSGARRSNRSSPSYLTSEAQRTDFRHGLINAGCPPRGLDSNDLHAQGCKQEYKRLRNLLSDSYNHFRCITYEGSVMASLGGFLVVTLYHQACLFVE